MDKTPIVNKDRIWRTLIEADAFYIDGKFTLKERVQLDGRMWLGGTDSITKDDLSTKFAWTDGFEDIRCRTIYLKDGRSIQAVKYTTMEFRD